MIVSELIEKLRQMPPGIRVVCVEGTYSPTKSVANVRGAWIWHPPLSRDISYVRPKGKQEDAAGPSEQIVMIEYG